MITFNNTGIATIVTKSGRILVYTDIILEGVTYNWAMYVPALVNQTLGEYLTANADIYEADIVAKEAYWLTIPHTEEISDPLNTGQTIIVNIPKQRIVSATIPDYEESVSDVKLDIAAIKRILQVVVDSVLPKNKTPQQKKDMSTLSDYWKVGKSYKVGDIVDYNGTPYVAILTHNSQVDWTPPGSPIKWELV